MADAFAPRSMKRRNMKNLVLSAPPPKPPPPAAPVSSNDEQLEIGIGYDRDLKADDLQVLGELGAGNGGSVTRVLHIPTNTIMARKAIHVGTDVKLREQIARELRFMRKCTSEYIVAFYGAYLGDTKDVLMLMECADVGSLDKLLKAWGPVQVDVLGKIAVATLGGLTYLYGTHHIMHRDIKPSNILINSQGNIKLCDFGVSGELINSVAQTFVGTSTYMAPERISGEKYGVESDVWSFGLTIMELAIGKFPFSASDQLSDDDDEAGPAGILDLLQQIVHEDPPRLPPSDAFPSILDDMLNKCLEKDPKNRPTPQELFDHYPFVQAGKRTPVDLVGWIATQTAIEKAKREAELEPQFSPGTQDMFQTITARDGGERYMQTPTSGEIPIAGSVLVSPQDQHLGSLTSVSDRSDFSPISTVYASQQQQSSPQQLRHPQQYAQHDQRSPAIPRSAGLYHSKPGRTGGSDVHPGLGSRTMTTDSVPTTKPRQQLHQTYHGDHGDGGGGIAGIFFNDDLGTSRTGTAGGSRANRTPFALPLRPPPPPKETREEMQQRRQAQF